MKKALLVLMIICSNWTFGQAQKGLEAGHAKANEKTGAKMAMASEKSKAGREEKKFQQQNNKELAEEAAAEKQK